MRWNEQRSAGLPDVHRYVLSSMFVISVFGTAPAIHYSLKRSYSFGNLIVLNNPVARLNGTIEYLYDPDNLFDVRFDKDYPAISYHLMWLLLGLSVVAFFFLCFA